MGNFSINMVFHNTRSPLRRRSCSDSHRGVKPLKRRVSRRNENAWIVQRVSPRSVCCLNQEEFLRSVTKAARGHLSGNCCGLWRGQRMRKAGREAQLTGCCCFGVDPFSCMSVLVPSDEFAWQPEPEARPQFWGMPTAVGNFSAPRDRCRWFIVVLIHLCSCKGHQHLRYLGVRCVGTAAVEPARLWDTGKALSSTAQTSRS